jgi:hypothetical protein
MSKNEKNEDPADRSSHMSGERKTAQMHVDQSFKNSGVIAIGESKKAEKDGLTEKGIYDFHDRGQKMKLHSYGTIRGYKDIGGRFYAFCREKYGINDISQLSYKFVPKYLDYCKNDRQNSASYIKKTIVSGLNKFNVIVNQSSVKKYDYYPKIQKWLANNLADCKQSDRVDGKHKAFDNPSAVINAIADPKYKLIAQLQNKYGYRSGDLLNINKFYDKDNAFLNNSKEGQKYKCILTHTEYAQLKSFTNDKGGFRANYKKYIAAIKDACIASDQRYDKGMGTHAFRYNFVRRSFVDLLNKGYSAKQAHAYLTEALFHHRQDADVPYLDALEGEFS